MNCPYCLEPVKEGALVCPHCASNLAVLAPVLARLTGLEIRLAVLEAEAAARAGEGAPSADVADGIPAPASSDSADPFGADPVTEQAGKVSRLIVDATAALVLLVLAHAILVFLLDWPVVVLRLVCVLIPLLCATRAVLWQPAAFGWNVAVAGLLGMLAVLAMSASVAAVDRVPVLPRGGREWRETLEFAFSIAMAWQTGYLLGLRAFREREGGAAPGLLKALAIATSPPGADYAQLERRANAIGSLTGSLAPVLTAGISVLSGLRSLLQ